MFLFQHGMVLMHNRNRFTYFLFDTFAPGRYGYTNYLLLKGSEIFCSHPVNFHSTKIKKNKKKSYNTTGHKTARQKIYELYTIILLTYHTVAEKKHTFMKHVIRYKAVLHGRTE